MKRHLNTLFVQTQGTYLAKDGAAVAVRGEDDQGNRKVLLRVPLANLGGIVAFGRVGFSPALAGACCEAGVSLTLMTERGRLLGRVTGFTPGNVLLRREQYRRADDPAASAAVAANLIGGKLANLRAVLGRQLRDRPDAGGADRVRAASQRIAQCGGDLGRPGFAGDLDRLRGLEGEASAAYFGAFGSLVAGDLRAGFPFAGRTRRPPTDPMNALLSFLYAMLANDARSACEGCGLDPQVGFLHRDRPGRASLALDLMEELRPVLADRLALSLINRRQITPGDFEAASAGGVRLRDKARRAVVVAYQKRKQDELVHPYLEEKVTLGLVAHLQARLLARHLRGDLDAYPPFVWK